MRRASDRLHTRVGASVFRSAVDDHAHGRLQRRTGWHVAALALSAAILTTPFLTIAAGLALMAADFPNLLTLVFGAILVWAGWSLLPRRHRRQPPALTRREVPALFALFDRVAAQMGTEAPDDLVLDASFNAGISTPILARRPPTRMIIGLPLWHALDDQQRIALVAHELGHRVNRDSARGGPVGLARHVLEGWIYFLHPADVVSLDGATIYASNPSGSIFSEVVTGILYAAVEALSLVLERLDYLDHNRAEYLADALAAEVAGTDAMTGTLRRLALRDPVARRVASMSAVSRERGPSLFAWIAEPARDPDSDDARRALARMEEELLTVDGSHPPTRFRIAFLEATGPLAATVNWQAGEMDRIDAELRPHAEALAEELLSRFERQ